MTLDQADYIARPRGDKLMRLTVVLSLAVTVSSLAVVSWGQMTAATGATGTPTSGVGHDYLHAFNETVDPATGQVNLRLKLPVPPGRGLTLPFSFAYNSGTVNYAGGSVNSQGGIAESFYTAWSPLQRNGWSYGLPFVNYSWITREIYNSQGIKVPCQQYTAWIFQDPSGGTHDLHLGYIPQSAPCNIASLYLNGGDDFVTATIQGPNNTFGPLRLHEGDGTVYYNFSTCQQYTPPAGGTFCFGFPQIEDRNGNQSGISGQATGPVTVTDTLGRTALSTSGFANNGDTVSVAGIATPYTVTWGTVNTTGFSTTSVAIPGYDPQGYGCEGVVGPQAGSESVITAITLPNGQQYKFSYDSTYGELNKITYPSGGYVRYSWGMNPQAGSVVESNCGYYYDTPAVLSRYVSFDGSTEPLQQTFGYQTTWNQSPYWQSKQTTVTTTVKTPAGTSSTYTTTYTYSPYLPASNIPSGYDSGTGLPASAGDNSFANVQVALEQTIVYKGPTGSTLRTVNKTWADQFSLATEQTTLDNGLTSEVKYSYGIGMQVKEKDEYDYGASGPGSLLRKTITNYQTFGSTPIYSPPAFNSPQPTIFDSPCQQIVYDGSGNRIAETDSYYDNGSTITPCGTAGTPAVTSVANLSEHDETNYAATSTYPRGNATTVVQQCFQGTTTCSNPSATNTYDETGQRVTSEDALGNITNYSYADSYSDTTPPKQTNAFITSITYPPANSVAHIESFSYDYSDSQLSVSTDENGNQTKSFYNDSLRRLTETSYPDGGQTEYAYNDTPLSSSVTSCELINGTAGATCIPTSPPSGWKTSTALMDGMGHTIRAELVSDPEGIDYADTTYDGLGRTYSTSNPYRSTSDPTYGITTYSYDVLNRVTTISRPDSSVVSSSYTGNCTTVTDEAGKDRKSCVDGLGRMTGVWENPSSLNYETDYAYDALNDLTSVNQKGSNSANARIRTFQYDSLSRLTTALIPESGTILYTYDANSNIKTKTAPAPNQTGSATVTTTYVYDALNRVTSKVYSDGTTPGNYYSYDVPPSWMTDLKNVVGRVASSDNQYGGTTGKGTATTYSYDALGRVVREWEQTPSLAPGGKYIYSSYDLAGNLTSTTTAAGTVISYGPYNGANRLTTVTSSLNDAQHPPTLYSLDPSVGYYPNGDIRKASLGNGLTQTLAFNIRLQPCRINVNSGSGYFSTCTDSVPSGNLLDFTMGYNAGSSDNGNVVSWSAVGNQTFSRSYVYDSLNRIQSMTDSASGQACKGLSWFIDAWGNATAQTNTGGTCYTFQVAAGTNNQVTGNQYDAAGNVTYGPGSHSFTYDAENRIIQVDGGSTSYVYNENGKRVRKNTGSTWTEYFYGPNGSVQSEYNGSWPFQYVYAGNDLIAQYTSSTTEFVHKDHLGSTRLLTGVNQGIVDSMDYLPFGLQTAGGTTTTHKFTGKERDNESGLDNFGARYYESYIGRFMSVDPISLTTLAAAAVTDPQSWNAYPYVRNDPLNLIDPTGAVWCSDSMKSCITDSQYQDLKDQKVFTWVFYTHHIVDDKAAGLTEPEAQWIADQAGAGNREAVRKFLYRKIEGIHDESGEILASVAGAKGTTFALGRLFGWVGGLLAPEEDGAVSLTSGQMGKIIGWGTGQSEEAVAQTVAKTESLTAEQVQEMANNGLTKEWVQKQLNTYTENIVEGSETKLANTQLAPRKALMEKILSLWQ